MGCNYRKIWPFMNGQFAIISHVTIRYGEKYRNGEETILYDNQQANILQCLEISYRWMT